MSGAQNETTGELDCFMAFDEGGYDGMNDNSLGEEFTGMYDAAEASGTADSFNSMSTAIEQDPPARQSGRKRASSGVSENPGNSTRTKTAPSPATTVVAVAGKGKGNRKQVKGKGAKGKGKAKGGKGVEEEDCIEDEKREERNLREKERSFKISRQIQMLRDLLNNGGVAVPKGTKSSVLTEAANYIRALQQHHFNSEVDRQNLVNKIRTMNSGKMGPQVQIAVRQAVATHDHVPQPMPPPPSHLAMGDRKALEALKGDEAPGIMTPQTPVAAPEPENPYRLHPDDYSTLFNCSNIPMAIATMGGSFIECNRAFEDVSGFPKPVLLTMTVFNVTSPPTLQDAFESISKMIPRGTVDEQGRPNEETPPPVTLEGLLKNGECRLKVFLAKDRVGNTKYFVVQPTPSSVQIQRFPTLIEHDFVNITG